MPGWAIWLIVAAALVGVEVFSLTFLFGPLAVAASLAALVAGLGLGAVVQIAVFAGAAIGSLAVLRPIALSHVRTAIPARTGTAALVGKSAVVLDRVDENAGRIKLAGEVWSARSYDGEQVFEPGQRVSVLEIQGATALVSD
ncbi:MAG TPA: NfeD family protein [Gaiellaceae bacterium]|jgi:membrane protein implicated in regulation of membrane protease activity|nr:NfeD family protein [Gaiellaceae bacterium]